MIQYGFEAREPVWVQGPHDAAYKETVHRLTDEFVHDGQRSETIQLEAERGNFIHYTYTAGRAPVTEDVNVSIWIRANRPGVQLLARVVFPKDTDANNPGQPLTALLEGDRYQIVNHWQQLALPSPLKLLRQQQQLLSSKLKREIITTDAYIDQLVLNVYAGPGDTKVWIDDLEIGPVFDPPTPTTGQTTGRTGDTGATRPQSPPRGDPAARLAIAGGRPTLLYDGHSPHRHPASRPPQCRLQHGLARRKHALRSD